jgi:haloacid dehalogenase-like hydrolase
MVLPAGVTKATGLAAALHTLGRSPHNLVGVGDAENDHAFLRLCECAVAVANLSRVMPGTNTFQLATSRTSAASGARYRLPMNVSVNCRANPPLNS